MSQRTPAANSPGLLATTAIAVGITAAAWFWYNQNSREAQDDTDASLPTEPLSRQQLLERFPSLRPAFAKSPMVGLYFAAAWCPDCVQATPSVRRIVQSDANDDACLTIVYISSDSSPKEMQQYQPACFDSVAFHQAAERTALKCHYGACAQKELRALQMTSAQRKHGIPTLILLESATGRVLTEKGVDHCQQPFASAEHVLDGWRRMIGDASATGDESFDSTNDMMDNLLNVSSKSNLEAASSSDF